MRYDDDLIDWCRRAGVSLPEPRPHVVRVIYDRQQSLALIMEVANGSTKTENGEGSNTCATGGGCGRGTGLGGMGRGG